MFPKELPARLKVEKGDVLYVVETQEGYLLTSYGPSIAEQVGIGRAFVKEYRDTFKALAK